MTKNNAEEEAADRTAGDGGLFGALATAADRGGGADGSHGKADARFGLFRSDHTTNTFATGQQEKNEGKERELAYSSFSAEKEERASVTHALLLIDITQQLSHRQKKLILENSLMFFGSILASAAQRSAV